MPFRILRHCTVYCYKEERKEQVNSRYIKILNIYISIVECCASCAGKVGEGDSEAIIGRTYECAEDVEEVTEV